MIIRNTKVVYAILVIFASTVIIGTTSVFADHVYGVLDYEWHIWSRDSTDGHTEHLNCDGDYCALKISTEGGIQSISQSQINDVVDDIESHFDSLGKKMSIDRVTTADSYIESASLDSHIHGKVIYDLHCVERFLFFWCTSKDMHFEKMIVQINNDPTFTKFALYEDESANPKIFDIRKTLGHELFHAMGIDHNSASNSIVFYEYIFGSTNGYIATTTDKNDLGARYP